MKKRRKKSSQSSLILLVMLISVVFVVLQTRWSTENRDRFMNPELIEQLQRLNPLQTIRVQCDHCQATGETLAVLDGVETRLPCAVCKGLSFVRLSIDLEMQAICPLCHGLQFIPSGDPLLAEECVQCLGEGVVETQDPYEGLTGPINTWLVDCHGCNKTGKMTDPLTGKTTHCNICLGLIYNEVRKFYDEDNLCPGCGGMGRIVDQSSGLYSGACERCEGRGAVNN